MDAYDTGNDAEAVAEFHSTLDEDSKFMDNVISKVSEDT